MEESVKSIQVASLAMTLVLLLQPSEPAPGFGAEDQATRTAVASGDWATEGRLRRAAQRWDLDLVRHGDVVRGTIDVADSPLVSRGAVQGRLRGRRIEGRIADESGTPVARFHGLVTPSGMSGAWRDRTGDSGTWEWTGRLP
jgi:hypothetical protein